jgi:hypothetical protein
MSPSVTATFEVVPKFTTQVRLIPNPPREAWAFLGAVTDLVVTGVLAITFSVEAPYPLKWLTLGWVPLLMWKFWVWVDIAEAV